MEILHIENLTFRYPKADKNAIVNIDLTINEGEFIVVCGESGCGKTTLLKLIKKELAPIGEKQGRIFYKGFPMDELDARTSASEIGYVLQNPDNQIVTDKVWHEIAFGLENIGIPTGIIRRRVAEMACYFGIQDWFRQNTDELSGGQKQLLNLAAIMVMHPKILILDEPTSQLDPIAASEFIATLQKLNRELGLTIILVEHRLEEVFPIADKVLLMNNGKIEFFDSPKKIGSGIEKTNKMLFGLPSAVRIFNALDIKDDCPITVKEGRDFLQKHFCGNVHIEKIPEYVHSEKKAIELQNVWFRYEKNTPDVLRETRLTVYEGELYCLLGGNGSGKTTTLNVIAALNKPYKGKIFINGKATTDYKGNSLYRNNIAYLPQNPLSVFLKDSIKEDFDDILDALKTPKEERDGKIANVANKLGIEDLLNKHPYDLSGGEQQKCAIAKMLLLEPRILLLDEPTKGLDAYSKLNLSKILKDLKGDGITVMAVTHDIEFAAENADRCALFFDGEILSVDIPKKFFADNNFYTTAANRIARTMFPNAVTCDQVVEQCNLCGGETE